MDRYISVQKESNQSQPTIVYDFKLFQAGNDTYLA